MKGYLIEAIEKEETALDALSATFLQECERVVVAMEECRGKVVLCGIGKSAHIGTKLVTTFASLGIPSFFIHVIEDIHGGPGMVEEGGIVTLISNNGTTQKIIQVSTPLHNIGCMTVACCTSRDSILAKACDLILIYPKVTEVDAYNLVPTSSTTLALVLGDATACVVSKKRGFNPSDFHKFRPNGNPGERLDGKSRIQTIHIGSHRDILINSGKSRRVTPGKELSKKRKVERPETRKTL